MKGDPDGSPFIFRRENPVWLFGAENKHYFTRIICGDSFTIRRITTIFAANLAEKNRYVFIQ